ncbi:MAG: CHASE2 domain-containing protein [Symploca sp. SIO2E9]|nr:CHASE2 domain-containing protein [Symploca sp. SIO2E9]
MNRKTVFQLRVKQFTEVCEFELSWGLGQIISAQLNYPNSVMILYKEWQTAYLSYYRQQRGRVKNSGRVPEPSKDWRTILVKAEAQFLDKFHYWLLSPELAEIRGQIASSTTESGNYWVDVFLTCTPLELARLPWETWKIGTDLGATGKVRIARKPANIRCEPVYPIQRKARILAILGDDTGLDFEEDKIAVRSLSAVASVECVGWRQGEDDATTLKTRICEAIADQRGWDVLFFAGHSNETALTGGQLGIAPKVSLLIKEIEEPLKQAKSKGLQFAIFNSCSGINIAESLINLGLSQVVVMREPIHNRVAQDFLKQLLKSLAEYKDVHEALLDACEFLQQQEKSLTNPSAYLVPSLFCHPEAQLFRIKPFGFKQRLKRWMPRKREARWLGFFLLLSLLPPVQDLLLEPRILVQSVYRSVTNQIPSRGEHESRGVPAVRLVQIDATSLKADTYTSKQINPIDYNYLAKLLNRLSQLNAKVIGIDYILDDPKQDYSQLQQSVGDAVGKGSWLLFGSTAEGYSRRATVSEEIAQPNWSMEGEISFSPWYIELPPADIKSSELFPFAYLLALIHTLNQETASGLPPPDLESSTNLQQSVIEYLGEGKEVNQAVSFLSQLRLHPITSYSHQFIQQWLHPIIDFSIPPNRVYEGISACKLLGSCQGKGTIPENFEQELVLIVPGGYPEAGLEAEGEDNYAIPLAVAFWRGKEGWGEFLAGKRTFTGGETHAYMIHHLLTQRLVVPIPDVWMILLAALLGKGVALVFLDNPRQQKQLLMWLGGAIAVYGWIGLQVYISAEVLLPVVLPSVVLWNYVRITYYFNKEKVS